MCPRLRLGNLSAGREVDAPIVEAFGEYCAMCLYSKNWMHREAALHKMESDVARGGVKSDREVFRAVCQCLARLFKDKVANVFSSSCRLLATATRAMGPGVGAREVHSNTANLVPQLLEKLGDAHAKARDAAREALMELAEAELALVAGPLVRPVRSQSAWRIVLGRLSIMLELVPRYGQEWLLKGKRVDTRQGCMRRCDTTPGCRGGTFVQRDSACWLVPSIGKVREPCLPRDGCSAFEKDAVAAKLVDGEIVCAKSPPIDGAIAGLSVPQPLQLTLNGYDYFPSAAYAALSPPPAPAGRG